MCERRCTKISTKIYALVRAEFTRYVLGPHSTALGQDEAFGFLPGRTEPPFALASCSFVAAGLLRELTTAPGDFKFGHSARLCPYLPQNPQEPWKDEVTDHDDE